MMLLTKIAEAFTAEGKTAMVHYGHSLEFAEVQPAPGGVVRIFCDAALDTDNDRFVETEGVIQALSCLLVVIAETDAAAVEGLLDTIKLVYQTDAGELGPFSEHRIIGTAPNEVRFYEFEPEGKKIPLLAVPRGGIWRAQVDLRVAACLEVLV